MGTERLPRELATQLKQDLTFSLHAEPQVRTKQVLEAVAAAVTLRELRSVRPSGPGKYFVTVHSLRAVDALRALGALSVGDKAFPLVSLASRMRVITVLNLPTELPDGDLDAVLGRYGRIIKSYREKYREYPTVEIGARKVLLEMTREVPNFIVVRGFQAMCLYSGMRKVCRRCGEEGHLAVDCATPRCRCCLAYGHEATSCEEKCKKCGGDHWTSRCQERTYASVANDDGAALPGDSVQQHSAALEESLPSSDVQAVVEEVAIASSGEEKTGEPSSDRSSTDNVQLLCVCYCGTGRQDRFGTRRLLRHGTSSVGRREQ